MKLPDKFWFYHKSYSSEIFFARKMVNDYFVSTANKETFVLTSHEVEEYFSLGYWVLTVPDEFNIRGAFSGKEFSVSKYDDGVFEAKDDRCSYFYGREEVLAYLYDIHPLWGILENTTEKPDKKPAQESPLKRLISINVNDARSAAEYDVVNNPHTKAKGNTVEEIEQEILGYLKEMYDALMNGDTEWGFRYTGTRTYRILFQPEDDSYGTISILSDTSIGMPTFFADVNDFLSQN